MASIPAAAVAAVRTYFPAPARATALAIAGAESGWSLEPSRVDLAVDRPYTCPPYSATPAPFSFGGWQISLQAYGALVPGQTACAKADYLLASWNDSARIAAAVWRSRGDFSAWSTWWADAAAGIGPGQGPYLAYLPAAEQALGEPATAVPVPAAMVPTSASAGFGGIGVPLVVLLAGALVLEVL